MEPNKRKSDASRARSVNNAAWPIGGFCCSMLLFNKTISLQFFLGMGTGRTYFEIAEGGEQFDRRPIAAEFVSNR